MVSEDQVRQTRRYPCEKCPLRLLETFRPFEPEELAFISRFKRGELSVERGATVLGEGTRSVHLYTVLLGLGFRYKLLPDGRRQILNYLLPGDLIGLQSSLMGEMQHSVEALSPMLLCVFQRSQLPELYRNYPGLAFDITWIAAREEQMLDENLLSIGRRTALERTAYLIAFVAARALAAGYSLQPKMELPLHSAAHRRYARAVLGAHQQDHPQARRAQSGALAGTRLRGGRPRRSDGGGRMGGPVRGPAARLSDGTAGQCREGAAGKTNSRLRSLDAGR